MTWVVALAIGAYQAACAKARGPMGVFTPRKNFGD
jgi:hypothetical protein